MSSKNPTTQNTLPFPIKDLSLKELFLLTRIPLHLLEGFITGRFKPNRSDREKLTKASLQFYKCSKLEKEAFVQKKKWKALKSFLSLHEKEELFSKPEKYIQKLDELTNKYWDQILIAKAQQ